MKIVLAAINAKYIHANLAVYSLKASAARACNAQISIAEYTINNYIDDILPGLYKERPDVLAFSCYIWNISMVEELADLIHKAAPWIEIWFGGPEVSYDAEDVLRRNPAVRLVMCGEGEGTFCELTAATCNAADASGGIAPASGGIVDVSGTAKADRTKWVSVQREGRYPGLSDETLRGIKGIVFRNAGGRAEATGPRAPVDMDSLPFPYEDMTAFKNKIIYYESSRGCPFSCSYCLSSIDRQVRFRSLELVKRELGFFLEHRVPQVKFVDRTFNCRHDRTMAILSFIREHDNGITNFHFEITADLLNAQELELLGSLRPGLVQLEIGVQSVNEVTIQAIDRKMDVEKLSSIVRHIRRGHNVHQHLDLIAGLPFEGLESFRQSFNAVYALLPQQLQLGFLKVLKGSRMQQMSGEYGIVSRTRPPYEVISTRWLSFDDVLFLKGIEEMVEVYYNSGQFFMSLTYLAHFFETPFDMFAAMAQEYERSADRGKRFGRLERYEMLKDFGSRIKEAKEASGAQDAPVFNVEIFDAILLYDLYLRENIKSRPAWAPDESRVKAAVSRFYDTPQIREQYMPDTEGMNIRQLKHETHVEFFDWDVPSCAKTGCPVPAKGPVLFDYRHREPLTYNARTAVICMGTEVIPAGT